MFDLEIFRDQTVLLTGSSGFIGNHLRKRLRDLPFARIVLLSRQKPVYGQENEICIETSLNDFSASSLIDRGIEKIDYLIHLAGFAPKNSFEANDVAANLMGNINATYNLLEGLPSIPRRIVFSSTLDVYCQSSFDSTINEDSAVGNSTFYGESKLLCESIVKNFAVKNDCDWVILRYGHIYGPGEENYQKLIPTTIKKLLKKESPVIYGDGSVLRDFLYVDDAVESTLRAVAAPNVNQKIINVVSGKSVAAKEIVEHLVRLIDFDGEISYLTDKSPGQSNVFDNELMQRLLGKWKLTNLESGLTNEVKSYFPVD